MSQINAAGLLMVLAKQFKPEHVQVVDERRIKVHCNRLTLHRMAHDALQVEYAIDDHTLLTENIRASLDVGDTLTLTLTHLDAFVSLELR